MEAARDALLVGDAAAALPVFAEAAAQAPSNPAPRYWLAAAMMQAGEPADDVLNDARTLHAMGLLKGAGVDVGRLRTDPAYAGQVAVQLYGQNLVACASVAWGMALSTGQIDAAGLLNLALSLQHQGRIEEAVLYLQVALENFPSAALHNFLVYAQLFRGEDFYVAEARAWAARWANLPPPAPNAVQPAAGRKLRIGYVAPRFAGSQLRQFIAPILEGHDPDAVEVTLYPAEAATEADWPAWIRVRPIGGLDDAAAADLIRADGIDVLNDCWGHTAGCRLGVFARKPAPVQVAWINFFHTTGLRQIDYVLHGEVPGAPDLSDQFAETLWRAGPVFSPFRASADRLAPVETPAKAAGVVTLASFNHPAKLSDGCLAAWATVLRNARNSRLLLKYRYYADPLLQETARARFLAHGVAVEQLLFGGHSTGEEYVRTFQVVDLMLDSWPSPGSTTTLEALSNGVPVLAMAEDSVGGVYARGLLEAAGLPELVTDTPETFVARALELIGDIDGLDRLRTRVRPGFDEGPLCDEAGFVRRLEASFRAMLAQASQVPAARAVAG